MIFPLAELSRASIWLQSFEIENVKIFHMGNKDEEFNADLENVEKVGKNQ
jgi:hypothetical protein